MQSMLRTRAALLITGLFLFAGVDSAQACHGQLCPKCAKRAPRQSGYGYGYGYVPAPAYGYTYWYQPVVYRESLSAKKTESDVTSDSSMTDIKADSGLAERLAKLELRFATENNLLLDRLAQIDSRQKKNDEETRASFKTIEERFAGLDTKHQQSETQFTKLMEKLDKLDKGLTNLAKPVTPAPSPAADAVKPAPSK